MNLRRLFLYLLIGSVALSAVIGIIVVLFGDFGEFERKVLLTAATVIVVSILGLACGAALEAKRARAIPFVGIVCAVISGALWVFLIWYGTVHNDLFVKSLMSLTLGAAACSHFSMLSLARLDARFRWSRYALHATLWTLTAYLLFLIWNPQMVDEDLSGRVLGVLAIILGALTVVTPVLHKLSSAEAGGGESDVEIERIEAQIAELQARLEKLRSERSRAIVDGEQ